MGKATHTAWRKSSHSGGGENCVELAAVHGQIGVRDSKRPSDPHLTFTTSEWRAFILSLRK